MKKIKRLNISYTPYSVSFALVAASGSLLQVHNADTNTYLPDRTLTPLGIEPRFSVYTEDGTLVEGTLHDVRWYVGSEVSGNLIQSGSNGYTIGSDGSLAVAKNITSEQSLILIFTGKFYDARNGNAISFHSQVELCTSSLSEYPVTLDLSHPSSWHFDPIVDGVMPVSIVATLRLAGKSVSDARQRYWWYLVEREGSGITETLISTDNLFYESGQESNTLTIDPRYLSEPALIRCKADYIAPGESSPSAPTINCEQADTLVARVFGEFDFEQFIHGTSDVGEDATQVVCEGYVTSHGRVVANPEKLFDLLWLIKTTTYGASWQTIGYGTQVLISKMNYQNGADVAFDVSPKKAMSALTINESILTINGLPVTI